MNRAIYCERIKTSDAPSAESYAHLEAATLKVLDGLVAARPREKDVEGLAWAMGALHAVPGFPATIYTSAAPPRSRSAHYWSLSCEAPLNPEESKVKDAILKTLEYALQTQSPQLGAELKGKFYSRALLRRSPEGSSGTWRFTLQFKTSQSPEESIEQLKKIRESIPHCLQQILQQKDSFSAKER